MVHYTSSGDTGIRSGDDKKFIASPNVHEDMEYNEKKVLKIRIIENRSPLFLKRL